MPAPVNTDDRAVALEIPTDASKNVELTKYYTFNETGNIMLATTVSETADIQESVRKVFAEVSVFFAAMTKAIVSTPDPESEKGDSYSLYNYGALRSIIDGSGNFIHVTEMDLKHHTDSWGANFSRELIKGLLGLATGAGALSFASAMVAAIGQEGLKISGESKRTESRVGNIVFVCEYLMGMPCISAIVVYMDVHDNSNLLTVGPCIRAQSHSVDIKMHKDTYMFVTPTFIREYAGDLNSINQEAEYQALIKSMRDMLPQKPAATDTSGGGKKPTDQGK